jgi:hypothetical protein
MKATENDEGSEGTSGLLHWQLSYQADQNLVSLKTTGPIEKIWLPAMFGATTTFAMQHHATSILADHRNSLLKLDPLEIYYCPKSLLSSGINAQYSIALLFSRMTEDLQFLENVCRNSGLHVAVFTAPDVALKWLTEAADALAMRRRTETAA